ncbi:MAG: transglycosylase domain-containing protein [Clostridiales bacterium]|nr:MAG: transglycosylase domain-containing protein [Clostridiales bacterium]
MSIEDIPQEMQNAIVAIEDERFYKHKGVDVKRTLGAVWGRVYGRFGLRRKYAYPTACKKTSRATESAQRREKNP